MMAHCDLLVVLVETNITITVIFLINKSIVHPHVVPNLYDFLSQNY